MIGVGFLKIFKGLSTIYMCPLVFFLIYLLLLLIFNVFFCLTTAVLKTHLNVKMSLELFDPSWKESQINHKINYFKFLL